MQKYNSWLYLMTLLMLSSCTAQQTRLDSMPHLDLLQKDKAVIGQDIDPAQTYDVSLQEALTRGVRANLDAQVAALEAIAADGQINLARINAFPSINLGASYIGRSNEGASSSQSVITGTQSLEPSFSTEQYRSTQDLTVNWSVLNILLAVSQTQNAKTQSLISMERYDKVIQNIQKDIYAAYYRALAAQKLDKETQQLVNQASMQLSNLKQAENKKLLSKETIRRKERDIQEKLTILQNLQSQLSLAVIELKSLLSLPQSTKLNLTEPFDVSQNSIQSILKEDLRALEAEALVNRPEVREQVLQRDIALQNIKEELIRTVPGGELFFGYNQDSNKFLRENNWMNFTLSVQQNLSALLSYNVRKKTAENQKEIEDARRRSLILAVMTQVHLARQRLDSLQEIYQNRQTEYKNAAFLAYAASKKAKAGFDTLQDSYIQTLEAQIKKINYYQSLTEVQDGYATLNNTLGRDLLK